MSRAVKDMAGMTAAWTLMGMMFAAAAVATVTVGIVYAVAAGAVGAREAAGNRKKRKSKG